MNKAANSGLVHFAVGITGEAKSRSRRFAAIVGWPRAERLWPEATGMPIGVRRTPLEERSNSTIPSRCSTFVSAIDSVGWLTCDSIGQLLQIGLLKPDPLAEGQFWRQR